MHDVKFAGALEYLRTVRCYVKFERERVELEKQVSNGRDGLINICVVFDTDDFNWHNYKS